MTIKNKDTIARTETQPTTRLFLNMTLEASNVKMISAKKLFRKCANIGTSILFDFRYKIHMQQAKTMADIMLPKLWNAPNKKEDIIIANDNGTINLNLFKNSPLNSNSSDIGAMINLERSPPTKTHETLWANDKFKIELNRGMESRKLVK